jgi:hypothetical protein
MYSNHTAKNAVLICYSQNFLGLSLYIVIHISSQVSRVYLPKGVHNWSEIDFSKTISSMRNYSYAQLICIPLIEWKPLSACVCLLSAKDVFDNNLLTVTLVRTRSSFWWLRDIYAWYASVRLQQMNETYLTEFWP